MDDDDLDRLLNRHAPTPSAAAIEIALLLAKDETAGPRQLAVDSRRWRLAATAVVGALALTGATSATAYQLSIPPFVALDEGTVRTEAGLPVEYTNSLGRRVKCLAFMDFANVDKAQLRRLNLISSDPSWAGYGDRIVARHGLLHASPEAQNDALMDVLTKDLWERAHDAVPEMVYHRDSDGRVYQATTLSCAGPGGVDGQ